MSFKPSAKPLSGIDRVILTLRFLVFFVQTANWGMPMFALFNLQAMFAAQPNITALLWCSCVAHLISSVLMFISVPRELCEPTAKQVLSAFSCITGAVGCVLNALILHYYVAPHDTLVVTLTQVGLGLSLFAIFICYLMERLETEKMAQRVVLLETPI